MVGSWSISNWGMVDWGMVGSWSISKWGMVDWGVVGSWSISDWGMVDWGVVGNWGNSVVDWSVVSNWGHVFDWGSSYGWGSSGRFRDLGDETRGWVSGVVDGTGAAIGFSQGVRSLSRVSSTGLSLRFGVSSRWVINVVFETVVWVAFVLFLLLLSLHESNESESDDNFGEHVDFF